MTSSYQSSTDFFDDYLWGTEALFVETTDPQPIKNWLWRGYIPMGAITLIEGAPGTGKSRIVADIISRVSSGQPFPDGSPATAGRVLVVMADGPINTYMRPLLDAGQADIHNISKLELVNPIDEDPTDENLDYFSFSDADFDMLQTTVKKIRPQLLVIDPIHVLLRQKPRQKKKFGPSELMRWLEKLEFLCSYYGCACIIVRSCKVNADDSRHILPLERSPHFWRKAHSVLVVGQHPSAPGYSFLATSKQRTSAPSPTWCFYTSPPTTQDAPLTPIQWVELSPFSALDLLKPRWASSSSIGRQRQRILLVLNEAYPNCLTPTEIQQLLSNTQLSSITQTLRRMYLDQQITKDTHGKYKANPIQPERLHLSTPIPPDEQDEQDEQPTLPPPEDHLKQHALPLFVTTDTQKWEEDLEQPSSLHSGLNTDSAQTSTLDELTPEPVLMYSSTTTETSPSPIRDAPSKPKPKHSRSHTKARSRPNSKHRHKK